MAQADTYMRTGNAGGMDTDSSIEDIAIEDAINRVNLRNTGSQGQQLGYDTNIESTIALSGSLLPGINGVIGGGKFDDTGQIVAFRYNSAGNCQMILYSYATNTYSVIYTDVTDSGGATLLPLNPQNQVTALLFNKIYLFWWAKDLEVGYCNLQTLASGGYGTVLSEDLSLLKTQCPTPIAAVPNATTPDAITSGYGSDAGKPANFLYGKLPQFIVQGINADFNYTAWNTRSKRFTPYQQNTPILGAAVAQNNYIVVAIPLWSTRLVSINVGVQFDDSGVFYNFKSVDVSYIKSLTHTAVDVSTEVYEAYNPGNNTYYFTFYNNSVTIPINPNETDLLYDNIWPSNSGAQFNGNLPALGDWKTLYPRPKTSVTLTAVGYNPNIAIPAGTYTNPLISLGYFAGASGSGAGNHRRNMFISLSGSPNTGDVVNVIQADIRNATNTLVTPYPVPSSQNGNLLAVVQSVAQILGGSYVAYGTGYKISFTGIPYFGIINYSIQLFFNGATVANSIATVLDNTGQQLALFYYDAKLRPMPVCTDNTYIITKPSYAQQNGSATEIAWTINTGAAPAGAAYYQWGITKPTVTKVLDTIATVINYKGSWNARTNSPTLAINSGNIGDTYQITTPFSIAAQTSSTLYTNLGHGENYNTGDYITNVGGISGGSQAGQYYAVLPASFGNLAATGGAGLLVFSLNSLALLNSQFSNENVTTNLVYDFAQGDRCTLHYWIDSGGNINYFSNPCIDLPIIGYDPGTYLVKVENSAALTYSGGHILYNGQQIDVRNIFIRLYSPAPASATASAALNETEWLEIGECFPVTNGNHSVLSGVITDGGAYYKTRQFPDAIQPYTNPPVNVLATDLNYSDFYPSAFYSFGRVRTYYDVKEQSEQQALIITGQPYVLGSRINGLNRFYPAHIYGNNNGQTSSSKGSIQIMEQVGQELYVLQELGVFRIPVNEAYTVLNAELTGQSISSILLNNGRYDNENVGIGTTKAFCRRYSTMYFVDPNKSLPYRIVAGRIEPISGKMTKFFQNLIQLAYSQGKRLNFFYNDYYEEAVFTVEADGGQLFFFPFSPTNWNPLNSYVITGTQVTATPNGAHCTASYNSATGVVTYTPASNYVGGDTPTFTFNPGGGGITLNNCLTWLAGTTTVNAFGFTPLTNQPLSTLVTSNAITVTGPNIPVSISITGGQYSINGGAYTSAAGTTNANDVIIVQQTTSGSNSTTTNAVLTVGSTSGTFTATTLAAAAGNYSVYSQYGVNISAVANGTCSGTPTFSGFPLSNGQIVYAAYTTTGGAGLTVLVTGTGTPAIPGHTFLGLVVGGVQISSVAYTGPGTYTLTFTATANNPTTIQIISFTA
jgi:hypothetical protein